MERVDLSKLKEASSSFTRSITSKFKSLLQSPTPESKAVDDATSQMLNEPNWSLNLRICAAISNGEYDGTEITRAIKRKLAVGKFSEATQRLSLELLELCASNSEKVFSEIASEKVLDEMVGLVDDSKTDAGVKIRALGMIRGWGESEELQYLPVFRQVYTQLKSRGVYEAAAEETLRSPQNMSYLNDEHQLSPPERYPIPNPGFENDQNTTFVNYGFLSIEEKKEFLVTVRNSLELLSSILNSDAEPKPLKDDLTTSMLTKCEDSLPIVQRIIETTSDDEVMLFDALNLHDELQVIISKYNDLESAANLGHPTTPNMIEISGDSNATAAVTDEAAAIDVQAGTSHKDQTVDDSKSSLSKPDAHKQSHEEVANEKAETKID